MEKEFVLYKEVLDLINLGFDEETLLCVLGGTDLFLGGYEIDIDYKFPIKEQPIFIPKTIPLESNKLYEVNIPTYQQAFRWFREEHNLFHEITLDSYREPYKLYARILKLENHRNFVVNRFEINHFDNDKFEEAELACLRKLIEIVKSK